MKHVEREGESWQDATDKGMSTCILAFTMELGPNLLGEIHIYGSRYNTIIPGICPIAEVVGQPLAKIIDHAAEEVYLPPRAFCRFAASRGATVAS